MLLYVAYPYWSLHRLGDTLEAGNEGTLKQHVDWPAVRSGLKEALSGILSRETGRAIASGDGEATVGGLLVSAIGNVLLEPLVDALVTPEGLAAMIREGRARKGEAALGNQSGRTAHDNSVLWEHLSFAFFTGPTTFEALFETEDGEDVVGVMQLNGMRWQLVRLRLPDSRATRGVDVAPSASPEGGGPRDEEASSETIPREMP